MKVSLKEARRIERRIENIAHTSIHFSAEIDIYEDVAVDFALEEARLETESKILNSIVLVLARSVIRRKIQESNEVEGVNSLIAMREQLIRTAGIWNDVIGADTGEASTQALRKMVDAKIERSKSSTSSYFDSSGVAFNTISESLVKTALAEKHAIQKKIDNCDDKIAAKNATATIELESEIVELLKENNII